MYMHANTHIYVYIYVQGTSSLSNLLLLLFLCTHTYIAHIHAHKHTLTYIHARKHTRTHIHTNTQTHKHTNTQTQNIWWWLGDSRVSIRLTGQVRGHYLTMLTTLSGTLSMVALITYAVDTTLSISSFSLSLCILESLVLDCKRFRSPKDAQEAWDKW